MRDIKFTVIIFIFALLVIAPFAYSQQAPTYSFIKFSDGYQKLKQESEDNGYRIKEDDIKSVYGQNLLVLIKPMNYYIENIYLFFNENKELIYFNVGFNLKENQPRRILEKLFSSIRDKLKEKYGESDNSNLPYYKTVENKYDVFLHPFQAYSNNLEISFKQVDKYSQYQIYYDQKIKKLENEDINKTINNF